MEKSEALQAGTVLESHKGTYKIIKVLGRGGFGVTYLVEGRVKVDNITMKGLFALKEHFISSMSEREGASVKVVGSNATAVSNSLKAFIKEATRLQKLGIEHCNIVKVNEVFEANNTAYYVMEYLEGDTLEAYVRHSGALSEEETLKFMQPIMHAIESLHANALAHYDIKPQNIILRKDEDDEAKLIPTLIDFGLAKHYNKDGEATSTNNVAGFSEGYSPSEQYAGIKQFSPWCDVYSLGATMLFCLTGNTPLPANDIDLKDVENEVAGKLSAKNCAALLKSLSFRRQDRQQSAGELYKDLYGEEAVVEVVDVSGNVGKEKAKQTDVIGKKPTHESKAWGKIAAVAAAVVLLILAAIFLLPKGSDTATSGEKDSDTIAQSVETPITPIILTPPIDEQEEAEEQEPVEEETPAPELSDFEKLEQRANDGDKDARHDLGLRYYNGDGVSQNYGKAVDWFKKSANQGHSGAQYNLGRCYENGYGVKLNIEEALKWYKKAAAQNHSSAKQAVTRLEQEKVSTNTPTPKPTTGTIAGHEYVDLGLSVKWATCNVGANSPSGYGNYYAWGETSTKSSYDSDNSKTYGKQMGNIGGSSQYDAAKANWGSSWRLPTKAEFEELKNNCTWTWTSQGGHNGYKVTSKKNGNSIFLPAAGGRVGSSYDVGSVGYYWSSTPYESDTDYAYYLYFGSSRQTVSWYDRYDGFSVRPVSE